MKTKHLIFLAMATLIGACRSNENANNTMNVDENLTTTDMNTTDMNATDMNAADMGATDMNVSGTDIDQPTTTSSAGGKKHRPKPKI